MNRRNALRTVSLVLLLVMLGATASAASLSSVLTYVKGQGFTPKTKAVKTSTASISYSEKYTGKDTLTWYTGTKRYTVSASTSAAKKKLRATYKTALKKYDWKVASYKIDNTLVYGLKKTGALQSYTSIAAYRTALGTYITQRASDKLKNYVLNTNSKKFHLSTCKDAARISAKNRRDVKCARSNLISLGYSPCKNCNP